MEAAMYAEVYLICMIVVSLLLYWTVRSRAESNSERWLRYLLTAFLCNFASNFLFKLVNGRVVDVGALFEPLSYAFKSLYFITLNLGVFAWCGYAEAEQRSTVFQEKRHHPWLVTALALPTLMVVLNLWFKNLFEISPDGEYVRHELFQVQMAYLFVGSGAVSCRMLRRMVHETDPIKRGHMMLTSSFPLCILMAWVLSFIGESVPVICVCVMVELLCIYTGTVNQQISLDKLTQVNNRQNLMGFLNYKLKNHEGDIYLMMMDIDDFKQINDTCGHLEGDNALVKVASALKRACAPVRKRPYIARYGGDEFIVVMEGTEADALTLAEDIRSIVRESADPNSRYKLSISVGLARYDGQTDAKGLIDQADQVLYNNKRARKH